MESMRAVGYTLETAVADIVDNSISANASRVDIYFNSATPTNLAIIDDGDGMTAEAIQDAMRLAGRNPDARRGPSDLGRFGLGLKTASLSQCRKLTVLSKRDGGHTSGYTWDLGYLEKVRRWALLELSDDDIGELPRAREFLSLGHGTMVLWRDLDKLSESPGTSTASLDEALLRTREHLALVFHRYLGGEHGRPFAIHLNGRAPERFDPFLKDHRATQHGPVESFTIENELVRVDPYTLPFITKLSAKDRQRAGVAATLRESQGFYIYREMRLVIWGTWFRIMPKDDTGRLARVQVDVPNSLDHLWALDIKKSAAVPPPAIRKELKRIVDRIIEPSRTVHRYRGRAARNDEVTRVWTLIEDRDGFRYAINRDHPLIRAIGAGSDADAMRDLTRALQLIEDSFPIHDAHNRLSGDQVPVTGHTDEALLALAEQLWEVSRTEGTSANAFIEQLRLVEPFSQTRDPEALLRKATEQ